MADHVAAPPRPKVNIQVPLWAGHVSVPASCPRDSRSPHRCLWLRDAYPRDGLIVFSTYTAIFAPPISQLASVPNTMPLVSVSRLVPSFLRGNSRRKSHTCDDNAKFGLYNTLHGRVNRSYASLSSFDTSTTSSGTTLSTHNSVTAVHSAPITDDLVEQMEDARLLRAVDPRSHLAVQIQAMEYLYRMFWDGYYDVDPPDAIQCLSEGPQGTAGAEGAEECQGAERGTRDEGAEECRGAERRGSTWLLHKGTQTTPAIILSAAEYDFASPAYNNIWWDMNHECLVAPYGQRRSHRKVRQSAKLVVDGTTLMQLDGADRWMATVCARIVQPVAAPPVVAPPVIVPAKRRSVKNKLKKLFQ